MNQLIDNAITYVKNYFQNESSGHDYFHTLRVYKVGVSIAKKEQANVGIVALVALLHDVDDFKLSPKTSKNKDNARNFLLSNDVEEELIDLICNTIDEISYKGKDTKPATTLEGRIVQDADRLDALGAIGVARAFAYGGHHNRVMHDPDILPNQNMTEEEYRKHISTTINHFYEKLFNLKSLMNTGTGKLLAESRDNFMHEYINHFLNEWEGLI